MSHRRRPGKKQREEERRHKEEESHRLKIARRRNKYIAVVLGIALSIGLLAWTIQQAPPYEWVRCYDSKTIAQHKHFMLYTQIGEKHGSLNVSFIRIPENLGLSIYGSCMYPMHTHTRNDPGERGFEYTKIHVEAPNTHPYTLGEFFKGWGAWMEYPKPVYFDSDGVSYYRTGNFEMLINRDPLGDGTFASSTRVYSYGSYVPNDGDYIALILHEPYTVVPGPYPGGEYPIVADFSKVLVEGRTFAFSGSASGGIDPYTYTWNFADGSYGSGATILHTFTLPGTYLVGMYVEDSTGVAINIRHQVSVA